MSKEKTRELIGVTRDRSFKARAIIDSNKEIDENNTISFVFISSDNDGKRYDWSSGEYYTERLDINGADVSSLNTFFKNHYRGVEDAIGKISNVRIENNELVGDVTFGKDSDSQAIYEKYRDGILTYVSVGYEILDYIVESRSNDIDLVTITNYRVFEVSAVGLGFDKGAKKRDNNINETKKERKDMPKELKEKIDKEVNKDTEVRIDAPIVAEDSEVEEIKRELEEVRVVATQLKRKDEIRKIADEFGERGQRVLRSVNLNEITPEEFRAEILKDFAGESDSINPANSTQNSRARMIDNMVDGLALRAGAKIDNPSSEAVKYSNLSLIDVARELLGDNTIYDKNEIAQRSMLSGEFPLLLQSVGARAMVAEFEAQSPTYKVWVTEIDVPDFRKMQDITAKIGGGRLDKIRENSDLKERKGAESAEEWKIESFGNKFILTREMIINDDLGAFTSIVSEFGAMAATTANGLAYDLLQNVGDFENYKMADGSGMYIASRNNSADYQLTPDNLSLARLAMSKHKSIDGVTPLRIMPKYLLVAPDLEVTAMEILGATSKIGADNVNVPNVHRASYELVVDPELKDGSWYLLADRRTIKMGYLAGTNRRPIIKADNSSLARTVFEGIFDIGVVAEDYRGIFRGNAGA